MKVGLQTISWKAECVEPQKMLHEIKQAGYDGVELAQIRDDFPNSAEFFGALEMEGVDLIGVAGGSLRDKLELIASFAGSSEQSSSPYAYTDEWDTELHTKYLSLVNEEFGLPDKITIAVHPHMFKPIQTISEAERILSQFDYAKLLIDTAHVTIAGDDILSVINSHINKIAAVHLKDWSPEFGRTLPYYSRGFVELGEGRIPVAETISQLRQQEYTGWIVVEQDYSPDPRRSAERSREYLSKHGV